jgi:hypothetical protein
MRNSLLKSILVCSLFFLGQNCKVKTVKQVDFEDVSRIEMKLSAFGVESAGFPNISATVDLKNDTSYCEVSYYDPAFRGTSYRLTKADMDSVRYLVTHYDLRTLKQEYRVQMTDHPTSTTIFYLRDGSVKVMDYSVNYGGFPLKDLYRWVYKLDRYFR